MKVAVIVNSNHPGRARPCFWKSSSWQAIFERLQVGVEYISIADGISDGKMPPVTLFRLDGNGTKLYDIIIISWDAINGDPVYLSDTALRFFKHYSASLERWVRCGGIVIVEFQSAGFRLVQDAYDVFGYDAVKHRRAVEVSLEDYKTRLAYCRTHFSHPLLDGINKLGIRNTVSAGGFKANDAGGAISANGAGQFNYDLTAVLESISRGWFSRSGKGWIPLLWADKRRHRPILLIKHISDNGNAGAYIVTAMLLSHLRAPEVENIIKNAVCLPHKLADYLKGRKRQRIVGMVSSALIVGIGIGTLVIWKKSGFGELKFVFSGCGTAAVMYVLGRYVQKRSGARHNR